MSAAHTPGPWTVKAIIRTDLDDDPMGEYVVEPASTTLGDQYFAAEPETPELDAVHAENQANAILIAASPELLAEHYRNAKSLEKIAARLESEGRVAKVIVSMLRIRSPASRAAIAKATGGVA